MKEILTAAYFQIVHYDTVEGAETGFTILIADITFDIGLHHGIGHQRGTGGLEPVVVAVAACQLRTEVDDVVPHSCVRMLILHHPVKEIFFVFDERIFIRMELFVTSVIFAIRHHAYDIRQRGSVPANGTEPVLLIRSSLRPPAMVVEATVRVVKIFSYP